jgi:hypothetical protein
MLSSSQTMAQARRTRLKRALTEVTSDTVSYVKTVGSSTRVLLTLQLESLSFFHLTSNKTHPLTTRAQLKRKCVCFERLPLSLIAVWIFRRNVSNEQVNTYLNHVRAILPQLLRSDAAFETPLSPAFFTTSSQSQTSPSYCSVSVTEKRSLFVCKLRLWKRAPNYFALRWCGLSTIWIFFNDRCYRAIILSASRRWWRTHPMQFVKRIINEKPESA